MEEKKLEDFSKENLYLLVKINRNVYTCCHFDEGEITLADRQRLPIFFVEFLL